MAHRWSADLERTAVRWHTVKTTVEPDPPDPPDPPGPGPSTAVYLRIESHPDTVREGQTGLIRIYSSRAVSVPVAIALKATPTSAGLDDFALIDSRGGAPSSKHVFVVIPPNLREDFVTFKAQPDDAVEGIEAVTIELDPSIDISGASEVSGLIKGQIDEKRWGAVEGEIEIDEEPVIPPVVPQWSHVGLNPLILPEESGINTRRVEFYPATEAPISIRLYTTNGTAIGGSQFYSFDREVEVPIGTTFLDYAVWIINDQLPPVGPSLTFTITGEIVLGVCDEADVPVLDIEIQDDDTPVGVPDVQFTVAGDTIVEPQTGQPITVVRVRATTTQPFIDETDVACTLTPTGIVTPTGYTVVWFGPVNTFRFPPGESFTDNFILINPNAIAANASIEVALVDDINYDLGAIDTYTLTVLEGSVSTAGNQLSVKRGLVTGRSMFEGIMAVVPPSATLPRFRQVANGEDCQVFGHARDLAGLWHSCWVVGYAAGDISGSASASSFAYEAGALELEAGVGTAPAEAAAGYPVFSLAAMAVRHRPCNTIGASYERPMSESLTSATATSEPQQTEGPSGALFTGVGPDLRQTFYFRVWLKLTTDATADVAVAEAQKSTRCCEAELWATYHAGQNVVTVEGRFANDTYKETLHPVTGARTWTSGEVNTRLLEIDLSAVDANWSPVWGTANPLESWNAGTRILTLLPDGAAAHLFAPNAEMGFRFALYDTTDATAQNMAIRMLRFQHHFVAVGPLSPCSNPCWEDNAAMLVDHGRAGFSHATFGQGWRGIFALGENRAAAMRSCVATGDTTVLDQRYGWMQTEDESTRGAAAPGGKNVHGISTVAPSAGFFEHVHAEMIGALCRVRLSCMDPYTGRLAWDHVMVETFNGTQTPLVCGAERGYHQTLPVFNRAAALVGESGPPTATTWVRAPATATAESRAWNAAAPDRTESPFRDDVDHDQLDSYRRFDSAHLGRVMSQLQGAWWCCRSFLARRGLQSVASAMTRGFSSHQADPIMFGPNGNDTFAMLASSLHFQNTWTSQPSINSPTGKGSIWFGRLNPFWNVGWGNAILLQTRSYAWACRFIVAAFISADNQTRAGINNATTANNWFTAFARNLDRRATEFGLLAECGSQGDPSPYNTSFWGPVNMQARTGAIPGPLAPNGTSLVGTSPYHGVRGQVEPYDQPHWTWETTFQADFMSHAMHALLHWAPATSAVAIANLQRILRRTFYTFEAHNASVGPLQGTGVYPKYTLGHAGLRPLLGTPNALDTAGTSAPTPYDEPPTLAQFRAGAVWWNIPATDSYGKSAMASIAAYARSTEADRQKYLRPLLAMLGINPPDAVLSQTQLAQAASAIYSIVLLSLAPSGGNAPDFYGEQTFLVPFLARLMNLANP